MRYLSLKIRCLQLCVAIVFLPVQTFANSSMGICTLENNIDGSENTLIKQAKTIVNKRQQTEKLSKYLALAPFIVVPWVYNFLLLKKYPNNNYLTQSAAILGNFISPFMVAQIFQKDVQQIVTQSARFVVSLATGNIDPIASLDDQQFELETKVELILLCHQKYQHRFTESANTSVKKLLKSIELEQNNFKTSSAYLSDDSGKKNFLDKVRKIISAVELIFNLPYESKDFILTDTIRANLNTVLATRQKDVKQNIESWVLQIAKNSKFSVAKRPIIFFLGEPGTGKTTLARDLATALEMPIVELKAQDLLTSATGKLFSYGANFNDSFEASPLTKALTKLDNNGKPLPKRKIILLDEIDKAFQANSNAFAYTSQKNPEEFFLKILDPKTKTLELDDLNLSIDIEQDIFILTANEYLSPAIQNRLRTVEFAAFTADERQQIAYNTFNTYAAKIPELKLDDETKTILDNIIAADTHKGVRTLVDFVIPDYITWFISKDDPYNQEAEFNISKAFEMYKESKKVD